MALDSLPGTDGGETCARCGSDARAANENEPNVWFCDGCGHRWRVAPAHYRPWHVLADLAAFLLLACGFLIRLPLRLARWIASESWRTRRFECWRCGAAYEGGADLCPSCEIRLPDAVASETLVPGRHYDSTCRHCHTPYAIEDYEITAPEHLCSRCGALVSIARPPPVP